MFELVDLIGLLIIVMLSVIWWQGITSKQIALKAVKRYCLNLDIQLLDDSVALQRVSLQRDSNGTTRLHRVYLFEFSSTGEQRYRGQLVLSGGRVQNIESDVHIIN